ncbi:hypothetical protein MCETHM1_02302 [Flavobacteriaceae bacterium]
MKKKLALILFLFSFCIYSQKGKSAEEFILSEITKIETNLIGKNDTINFKTPNGIVCLTGISTKKVSLSYIGIIYYPTLEDVKLWREWISKYHGKFYYDPKEIDNPDYKKVVIEYEKDKFRSNYCK